MLKKKMHADFKNLRNQIIYFAHKSRSYFKTEQLILKMKK